MNSWQLDSHRGPQSIEDRNDLERLNYLGTPKRYMWYSATIFKQELTAWRLAVGQPDIVVTDFSEADFVELLQRTSARGANHAIVRNYVTKFSGPQSWVQRSDAVIMSVDARVKGRSMSYQPKEFELLWCNECKRWRRVDLDTGRLFSNWHWL